MSIFLSQILEHKKDEVARAKGIRSLDSVIESCHVMPSPRPFVEALRNHTGAIGLIAEVKKASPSAGVIRTDFDYLQIAKEYEEAGADCISVLTDERFFQGKLSYLSEIKQAVSLPLLRKDFIVDEYQIYEARAAGADAILLIVAALEQECLEKLYAVGRNLGLDILVETHTEAEMKIAASLGFDLIGINSRDLKSFVTDLAIIDIVAKLAPPDAFLVAESGIKSSADVKRLHETGVSAILVGETLMRAENIRAAVANLLFK
jgi:indole-3-glycerol phosphate synthase